MVKLLGDGVLLAFDRSDDAVAATIALGTSMAEAGLPLTHAGIHAGPVITRDGDVYGGTVNTAARVASRARPGEVLVTQRVVDLTVDGALAFVMSRGQATLKGLAAPIRLFVASRIE